MTTIADLFDPVPEQWGLRGAPYLWREMQASFADTVLPETGTEFRAEIDRVFLELVGVPISDDREMHFVDRYAKGGMSSGQVSLRFWSRKAICILALRFANASGRERLTDGP